MPALDNPRHERFAIEYLVDLKAGPAYTRAGYKAVGNAAEVNGHKLLRNAKVAARIEELTAERNKRTKIDADWVLSRLSEEVDADVGDIIEIVDCEVGGDEDDPVLMQSVKLKPITEWPPIWRKSLVAGLKIGRGGIVEVKLTDRGKKLELIGRHVDVQAFKDRVEHSADESMADVLRAAREAAKG